MNPLVLAAFLVFTGNAASFFDSAGLPGAGPTRLLIGVGLAAALLVLGPRAGLDLGLRAQGLVRAAVVGAVLGAAAASVGLLLLAVPPFGPLDYAPARTVTREALALHLAVFLPLGVVLPEELAFRGALLAALLRRTTTARAIVVSSAAFALWHATIVVPTIRETSLAAQPLLVAAALLGAALVLFGGGIALATLRLRAGTLAAPLAAHWAFNAALLLGLAG